MPVDAVISVSGAPTTPEPAAEHGFKLERSFYTLDGEEADATHAKQNDRFVVVLKVTEPQPQFARVALTDYVPAGFEIDNPRLVSSGDTGTLDWIENAGTPTHTEFRDDRFTAAFERRKRRSDHLHGGLCRARGVARELCAAAGGGRGHVSARPLRPHRDRRGRGGPRQMSDAATAARPHSPHGVGAHARRVRGQALQAELVATPCRPRRDRRGVARSRRSAGAIVGTFESLRAAAARARSRSLDLGARPQRQAAQGLSHQRRPLAASGHARAGRSASSSRRCSPMRTSGSSTILASIRSPSMRAAYQFVTHGRIVSGGSTITMQVARLLEPRQHRSLDAKIRQTVRALELEWALSKDEILGLYLTLAPYGGNLEGMRAASLAYFGKEPRRLTLGEAALLVALPQSPEHRRPDRFPEAAKRARNRVLDRIAGTGLFSDAEIAHAKNEKVPTARKNNAADRPACRRPGGHGRHAEERVLRLTIDARLQRSLERLARDRAAALGPDMSVAMVVVDNATGEVLARVASPDYFDERRAGQVDLTQAVRSPGSALKPFIYGLGFEDGLIHPETLIEDRPIRYAGYAPENFDLTFQGTVTVRRALQQSLNVPAVAVLDAGRAEPADRASRRRQARRSCCRESEAPGLALGLGGVGVRLTDLTMLYAGLARQGTVAPLIERLGAPPLPPSRLIEPVAAWYVGNVLLGTPPPENAAGGRIAFKTGTSYGYRDAWAVGFDGKRTIGVWVGRPDGAPVAGLVGRIAAAPILFDAFARMGRSHRSRCRRRRKARSSPRPPSCRRRCSASRRGETPARPWRRRCISCFRQTARASNWPASPARSPTRSPSRSPAAPLPSTCC